MIKDYKAFWLNYFNVNKSTTRGAFWCAVISNILIQFYLAFFTCYAVSQSLLEDPLAVDKLTAGIIWDAEYIEYLAKETQVFKPERNLLVF